MNDDYEAGHFDGYKDGLLGLAEDNWNLHVDDMLYEGVELDIAEYKRGYRDGYAEGADDLAGDISASDDGLILDENDMRAEQRDIDLAEIGD
ncbi:hypothetical protein [Bifidobacterium callitrichidarum]|uniref:Uncharacterized protein n=1 Tax=Bifidobacterium callitrichidarum TaxID=2052941 RepID=A0A2U2N8U7_9BIFI|nr:hypothetical protein [Bifidobacterium callitrichidarum]PWG65611.1 hypothetical protein DF196_06670 [Bifidobacterium callitrichidarum]